MSAPRLLFDIGGTKTRLAVAHDGESFSEPEIVDTPRDFGQAVEKVAELGLRLCGGSIAKAAGGVAGPLNREKTGLVNAPNLPGWNGQNFVAALSQRINAPVFIENDTAIVGLGEAIAGPGKNFTIVVYITISTGVNGVKISNRTIDENVFGFEIGHQIIDFDNSQGVGSSGRGELEDFVSGRETEKRYGMHPKNIEKSIWPGIAKWAAVGVHNTVLHWSPEIVILGGSMMNDIQVSDIQAETENLLGGIYPEFPKFAKAQLASVGGLWGALHYIKSK